MVNVNGKSKSDSDPPLSNNKLLRQFDIDVIEDVPENLRAFDIFSSLQPFQHETIERRELESVSTEPIAPFHPPWLKGTGKPKTVVLSGRPKQ